MASLQQRCNRVTSIDPDDPLTHWFRPGYPDNDPDVTRIINSLNQGVARIKGSRTIAQHKHRVHRLGI